MKMETPTYRDFVTFQSRTNPCIAPLARHVGREQESPTTIVCLDYLQDGRSPSAPWTVAEADLANLKDDTRSGRVLLVENIQPRLISLLGEKLDIDPIFFAGHVTTDFGDIEKVSPPPSLALLPSQMAGGNWLHIHYQQVLDLGNADLFSRAGYAFETNSNVPRNIRRLPPLSGRQLALARACCSVLVKRLKNSWICLILTDPPITVVVPKSGLHGTSYPSKPLHGGFEDFVQSPCFSSFRSARNDVTTWERNCMLASLLHYFNDAPPPKFSIAQPSLLSLCYYPIRISLAEWNIYTHLTSRYFKHYEYSLQNLHNRQHESDLVDLQRWRRRSRQSQHKLVVLAAFIRHWHRQEAGDRATWALVLNDIRHLRLQMEQYGHSLEQMVLVATSMVQLLDSRRSTQDAANVKRLTYIALIFVPLSWIASLFSMSDNYSPGHEKFWVYVATALPVLLLVVLLSLLRYKHLAKMLKRLEGCLRPREQRQKNQVEFV